MTTTTKRIPIYAGMRFLNGKTVDNKMRKVGFKVVKFEYNNEGQLISEKEISRKLL